jgi:hypothetical protein
MPENREVMSGREIAMSVDPNTSDDVCTFCRHADWGTLVDQPKCTVGHTPYFRSLSNVGLIWVSNCNAGELRPELAAMETPDA